MIRRARAKFSALPYCLAALLLPFFAGCGNDKPPEPAAPRPAVIPPPQPAAAKPAPPPVAQPAAPSAKQKADAELVARVKAALGAEPQIQGFAIDVTADKGVVSLFGTAQTKARRDKAGAVAAKVAGVKSVENHLAIVAGS